MNHAYGQERNYIMSKFFMECPSCKMPVLASTGLFAKKKIKCGDCGCLVMVEKMAEEPCPKCGSAIVLNKHLILYDLNI